MIQDIISFVIPVFLYRLYPRNRYICMQKVNTMVCYPSFWIDFDDKSCNTQEGDYQVFIETLKRTNLWYTLRAA